MYFISTVNPFRVNCGLKEIDCEGLRSEKAVQGLGRDSFFCRAPWGVQIVIDSIPARD